MPLVHDPEGKVVLGVLYPAAMAIRIRIPTCISSDRMLSGRGGGPDGLPVEAVAPAAEVEEEKYSVMWRLEVWVVEPVEGSVEEGIVCGV